MKKSRATLIDLVEAVYAFELEDAAWVDHVLTAAARELDHGLGIAAATYTRSSDREFTMHQKFSRGGVPDLLARIDRAAAEWPRELYAALLRPGLATTLSKVAGDHPEVFEAYARHVEGVKDVLGMTAVDPDGLGLLVFGLLPETRTLTIEERDTWTMIAAHLAAGHRLRRGLDKRRHATELPYAAEAVIDVGRARVAEASGAARDPAASDVLRRAAQQIDKARGPMRNEAPEAALKVWKGLTEGRWSLVDWFDTDDRRFVLALPNEPRVADPRGLSSRESLVATYAIHGDTVTMIAYRLGLSKAVISSTLKLAMRKLGVQNRAELIRRFRPLEAASAAVAPPDE